MNSPRSKIESLYQDRIDAMTSVERVARSAAMFQWTKEQISRQIMNDGEASHPETLKWKVALRLYGNEPIMRTIIEQKLADVSR